MIVCLLMVMVSDDCLFVDNQSSLTITINKQTIISHHYHQQTNKHLSPLPLTNKNHLSPLPSTNKKSSLFVNGNGERCLFVC
jgi:hypothetical protein